MPVILRASLLALVTATLFQNPVVAVEVFHEDFNDGDFVGWHRRPDQTSTFSVVGGVLVGQTVPTCCTNAHMLALDDWEAFPWGDPWSACVTLRMTESFEGIATMGILVSGPPEAGRELDYEMPPHTTPLIEANLRNPGSGIVEIQATNITPDGSGPSGVLAQAPFPWQMDTWYTLCLAQEGTNLKVYVDGDLILTYPFPTEWLSDFRITRGAIILYGYRSSAEYDDVRVDVPQAITAMPTTWSRIKGLAHP